MKIFLPILIIATMVLASFFGGAYLATYRTSELIMDLTGRTAIQEKLDENLFNLNALQALYREDYSGAVLMLEIQLSTFLQNLDTYADFTDKSSYESICMLFHYIHQQQQKEPGIFISSSDGSELAHQASLQQVNGVVSKWSKISCIQPVN